MAENNGYHVMHCSSRPPFLENNHHVHQAPLMVDDAPLLHRHHHHPYQPNLENLMNTNNVFLNQQSNFQETAHNDHFLESQFRRLSIPSSPIIPSEHHYHHPSMSLQGNITNNNSASFDAMMMGAASRGLSPSMAQPYSNEELHRMRVQSAVNGQQHLGVFMHPHHQPQRQQLGADNNSLYWNTGGMRRVINGLESENSSVLSSLHENKNLFPSRRPGVPELMALKSNILSASAALEEFRGKLSMVARDQHGCRLLQKKFEEGNPEDIDTIFNEVRDDARELMVDQFGNYLMQKLFEVCSVEQINQLLLLLTSDDRHLLAICLDMHGTRAMQKFLEHLTTAEQRSRLVSSLKHITVTLTKSMNGHHVIQHCLKFYSMEDNKHILNVVADHCLDIATDKSGCCVLQQCVEHAQGELRDRLFAEITANALLLSENQYGNYVVQYLLGLKIRRITGHILAQLKGSFVSLSMNKYSSNVVEKCLREAEEEQAMQIIKEIINSRNFLMVLQDSYGNYVAQSALATSRGSVRDAMVQLIHIHYPYLHSHPHGKRVLARVRGGKQRVHSM